MSIRVGVLAVCLVCFGMPVAFVEDGDEILGRWVTEGGKSHVEITKSDGKYNGKIVWLNEPNYPEGDAESGSPKHDRNNPDPLKQSDPILGLRILKDFVYEGKNVWKDGSVYDPENGRTYKGKMTLDADKKLSLRGYIGISLIGRTTEWIRYEEPAAASNEKDAKENAK